MHRGFWEKPKEKGPFGKSRRAWDDNIEMYIKEIGWKGEVSDLAYDKDKWP